VRYAFDAEPVCPSPFLRDARVVRGCPRRLRRCPEMRVKEILNDPREKFEKRETAN